MADTLDRFIDPLWNRRSHRIRYEFEHGNLEKAVSLAREHAELDSENALCRYILAGIEMSRGFAVGALREVEAGNKLPVCRRYIGELPPYVYSMFPMLRGLNQHEQMKLHLMGVGSGARLVHAIRVAGFRIMRSEPETALVAILGAGIAQKALNRESGLRLSTFQFVRACRALQLKQEFAASYPDFHARVFDFETALTPEVQARAFDRLGIPVEKREEIALMQEHASDRKAYRAFATECYATEREVVRELLRRLPQ